MKAVNTCEMKTVNGGIAFSSLCGVALFFWGVANAGWTAKAYLKRR